MSSYIYTNDPEYVNLFNFLVEKTKDAKSPLSIASLLSEFQEQFGQFGQVSSLEYRYRALRDGIQRLESIDMDTRVRMIFALKVSIDQNFLNKLREQADVTLDDHQRIIGYKKKGGGLELGGIHGKSEKRDLYRVRSEIEIHSNNVTILNSMNSNNFWTNNSDNIELLNFLIEKTKDAETPLNMFQLVSEFKEKSKSSLSENVVWFRIERLRPMIHEMDDFDTATKVKLLFALSVPINKYFLEYLKTRAEVVLDNNKRIIEYRKYQGGLELKGVHAIVDEKERDTINRDRRMMEFLAQKAMRVDSPISGRAFLKDFKEATGATERITYLQQRYNLLRGKIHIFTEFDERTKLRMLFVSSASVSIDFLEILRSDALVEVDEKNRIVKYVSNDGSLTLEGDHSQSTKCKIGQLELKRYYSKQITNYYENKKETNDGISKLIRFIAEKCENVADSPLSPFKLAKKFSKQPGSSTVFSSAYARVRGYCREIQNLDVLDTPTKVKQLFVLSAPLNIDFLKGLRKDAIVKVDKRRSIIKYVSNDGSLTLERSHPGSKKDEEVVAKDVGFVTGGDEEELDQDRDEYTSEEFDSEFDSGDENHLDRREEEHEEPSKGAELCYEGIKTRYRKSAGADKPSRNSENRKELEMLTTKSGRVSKKRNLDVMSHPQKSASNRKRASKKSAKPSKRRKHSRTNQFEEYDQNSDNFRELEVKLEPFRGSLIDGYVPIDPDDDIQMIPTPELLEPKKEVEEEKEVKFEDDFIIRKQEELEEFLNHDFALMDSDDDIKGIPTSELRQPKKEIEEEQFNTGMMEFPIKNEDDFIIPKQEELEDEEDIKPEFTF